MASTPKKKTIETVAVFCSSRGMKNEVFVQHAEELGRMLYPNGVKQLVYGGGTSGLMGVVARSAQQGGCKITGIITHAFTDSSFYKPLENCVDEVVRFKNARKALATRKERMIQMADAIIILPGGIGTMGEQWMAADLLDMQMVEKSSNHAKPIIVLNSDGIYDGIKMYMRRAISERDDLIHPGRERMIRSVDTPAQVIAKIKQWNEEGVKRVCDLVDEYDQSKGLKLPKPQP